MEQALMLLTSDVPSYDLPGLHVKIPNQTQSRKILERDTGPIYGELKQSYIY